MGMFAWLGGMLSDPNDRQGSTHRVCLLVLIMAVCAGLILIALATCRGNTADVPPGAADLVKFLVTVLVGGIAWSKGVAGAVAIKAGGQQ